MMRQRTQNDVNYSILLLAVETVYNLYSITSTLTVKNLENSSTSSSQANTNLDTLRTRLTKHHSRTLHMVYPKISRAILAATLQSKKIIAVRTLP